MVPFDPAKLEHVETDENGEELFMPYPTELAEQAARLAAVHPVLYTSIMGPDPGIFVYVPLNDVQYMQVEACGEDDAGRARRVKLLAMHGVNAVVWPSQAESSAIGARFPGVAVRFGEAAYWAARGVGEAKKERLRKRPRS